MPMVAVAAQVVALAAGSPAPRVVAFGEVAPVAMMLGSAELLRAWVLSTLAGLAADDEHRATWNLRCGPANGSARQCSSGQLRAMTGSGERRQDTDGRVSVQLTIRRRSANSHAPSCLTNVSR